MNIEEVIARLEALGYEIREGDEAALLFAANRTEEKIKNYCNVSEIPDGLHFKAVDMACGDFLNAKSSLGQLSGYAAADGRLIKTVSEGDTTVTYQDSTAAAELRSFIDGLCGAAADSELIKYRKLCW